MEYRLLEITLISAKGLRNVKHFSKMDVYVVVTISGNPRTKQKTPVNQNGGTNPTWNFPMQFIIDEMSAQANCLDLIFQLRCDRTIRGDKDIGEVHVPIKEILNVEDNGNSGKLITYQVRKPSGKIKGELNFSYKFSDKVIGVGGVTNQVDVPVTAYPPSRPCPVQTAVADVNPAGGYPPAGYPPPVQPPAVYPAPPPYGGYWQTQVPVGQGYPQSVTGYGYPPVQQVEEDKIGLGLEAVLAGLIGGLLIGEMLSDAAPYDAECDAGFDDGGPKS